MNNADIVGKMRKKKLSMVWMRNYDCIVKNIGETFVIRKSGKEVG